MTWGSRSRESKRRQRREKEVEGIKYIKEKIHLEEKQIQLDKSQRVEENLEKKCLIRSDISGSSNSHVYFVFVFDLFCWGNYRWMFHLLKVLKNISILQKYLLISHDSLFLTLNDTGVVFQIWWIGFLLGTKDFVSLSPGQRS